MPRSCMTPRIGCKITKTIGSIGRTSFAPPHSSANVQLPWSGPSCFGPRNVSVWLLCSGTGTCTVLVQYGGTVSESVTKCTRSSRHENVIMLFFAHSSIRYLLQSKYNKAPPLENEEPNRTEEKAKWQVCRVGGRIGGMGMLATAIC